MKNVPLFLIGASLLLSSSQQAGKTPKDIIGYFDTGELR
jgi:hypothetical protein